jgi:hypothetical protein
VGHHQALAVVAEGRRQRPARLPAHDRLFGQPPQRVIAGQHPGQRPARRGVRQQRPHRGIGEQQLSARVDDRHRVLELFDRRLEVRDLAGHLGSIRRELLAHRVEKGAELAELVLLVQVELHANLALAQACQSAADHVNRTEEQLRQQRRDHHRNRERAKGGQQGRPQRLVEIVPDQQRRHADPRRSDFRVAEQQRAAELEVLSLARVDGAQL